MVTFKDWIYTIFPRFFRENDTDLVNGKGLFERYVSVFGDELDQEMISSIQDLGDLNIVLTTDAKYLAYLAWMCGNPPDLFYNTTWYRKFIKYFTDIVKKKGTEEGYNLLFGLVGCSVTITEVSLAIHNYDVANAHHDSGLKYDMECPSCSQYDLEIHDPDGNLDFITTSGINTSAYLLLMAIIRFLEPINAKLRNLTYEGDPVADEWVLTTGIWNDSLFWNDNKYYNDGE